MATSSLGIYRLESARDSENWATINEFVAREPLAFHNDASTSHVTGSACLLNRDSTHIVLTHHRKLDRWLQLGGHCDGVADVGFVALREAYEESGLARITPVSSEIVDIDIHEIPAAGGQPAHLHYDVRYAFRAIGDEGLAISDESHDMKWVALASLHEVTQSPSVLVLRDKLARFV